MHRPHSFRAAWRAVLCSLPLVVASFMLFPTTSHAIPVAGDYVFTAGLKGTFTTDGGVLTKWDFTDPFGEI